MIYTVARIFGTRQVEIKDAPFISYGLGLTEHPTRVDLLQKPDSPEIKEGDKIEGIIEAGKEKGNGERWPDKLKRVSKQQGFRPRDPKETASIVRQHSQEMAIRMFALRTRPISEDEALAKVKSLTDWFQADATSEVPTEAPKATREAIPRIPRDRAKSILKQAESAGRVADGKADHVLRAKLTDVGVQSGLITDLTVDQAEAVEAWLRAESRRSPDAEDLSNRDEFLA